ncbi:MAG: DUF4831 family protein [Bacteroidales bacterium]|nr:DUF4831 family protein [Candidatus Cacconaster scatequi]
MKKIFISAILIAFSVALSAQSVPNGSVIYALPRTTVTLTVEAQYKVFTAGPYAQYAQKYLGYDAKRSSFNECIITDITVTPYVEADPAERYAINLSEKVSSNFLQFCSQGLIVMSDSYTGKQTPFRFASQAGAEAFIGKDPEGNLAGATTTLFRLVKSETGFEKVGVQQSQVVEKSLEKKAEEAAKAIFNIRERKTQIITGDTDATFSGEAMNAAVTELNRMEEEYLSLFYGITETSVQKVSFDVIPKKGVNKYSAFKIADKQGLVSASAAQGRVISLELTAEDAGTVNTSGAKSSGGALINYRIPAVVLCKVVDSGKTLFETRFPVYQLGQEFSFPINTLLNK